MRVHIKTSGKFRCIIPAPLWVLSLAFKIMARHGIKKYISKDEMRYLDAIDFEELNRAVKVLSKYKGMEIVNVNASDGTKVKIIL